MREILFRCWNKFDKKFIYFKDGLYNSDIDFKEGASPSYFFNWEHAEQFTGLLDKNSNKIFESDIIKTDDNDIINVSYGIQNIDAFETIGFNLCEFYGNFKDRGKAIRLQNSIEIIGNIHE